MRPDTTPQQRAVAARREAVKRGWCGAPTALSLELVADQAACEAQGALGYTDGLQVVYDPERLMQASYEEALGLLTHECIHVELLHPERARSLIAEGISLEHCRAGAEEEVMRVTRDCKADLLGHTPSAEWEGMSMEAIARTLHRRQPKGSDGNPKPGQGTAKPGATIIPAPDTAAAKQQNNMVKAQALARAAGKKMGELPADLARLVRQLKKPAIRDLYAALLDWRAVTCRGTKETDWTRPDRYQSTLMGAYLPASRRRGMPALGLVIDTSGSVQEAQIERMRGALARLLDEEEPEAVYAFAADTAVNKRYRLEVGDAIPEEWPGGGGTDFRPALAELVARAQEEEIAGCIYLTDLQGRFPEKEPSFPVLWVVDDPGAVRAVPPFGAVVYIE